MLGIDIGACHLSHQSKASVGIDFAKQQLPLGGDAVTFEHTS